MCKLCSGAQFVLSMDPDGLPWGARSPGDIAARALACARATLRCDPDVLVFACNTASVQALGVLRTELEATVPVVGTVPAIKPAVSVREPVAVWATAATTGSAYQRDLIERVAEGVPVAEVACPGLAEAIEAADEQQIEAAVAWAAAQTPPQSGAIVLGCTHYELAAELIHTATPYARVHGSAAAVAAQALRRARETGASATSDRHSVRVLCSGRPSGLPAAALRYPEGRLLARHASAGAHTPAHPPPPSG